MNHPNRSKRSLDRWRSIGTVPYSVKRIIGVNRNRPNIARVLLRSRAPSSVTVQDEMGTRVVWVEWFDHEGTYHMPTHYIAFPEFPAE